MILSACKNQPLKIYKKKYETEKKGMQCILKILNHLNCNSSNFNNANISIYFVSPDKNKIHKQKIKRINIRYLCFPLKPLLPLSFFPSFSYFSQLTRRYPANKKRKKRKKKTKNSDTKILIPSAFSPDLYPFGQAQEFGFS